MADKPMRIVELQAEAVKRIKAVRIKPDGSLVVITGSNGAGKSSVLDSIEWALAGERAIDAVPIRAGETRARIVLDLGDLVVERVFRKGASDARAGSTLVVKNREGMTARAPQALLDRLVGDLAFDPAAFVRMKPAEQVGMLRRAVSSDVDFEQLDARRADLFQQRRDVNRDQKAALARAGAFVVPADVPAKPHDLQALMDDVNAASASNALRSRDLEAKARIEREIVATKTSYNSLIAQLSALKTKHDGLVADLAAATVRAAVDVEPLTARYTAARVANEGIRLRDQRAATLAEAETLGARAEALTEQIEGIDRAKADAIANAKLPVKGLSWSSTGVTLDGLPFEQASTAQQIRVAVAIAMAANPRLRILRVKEGSNLDQANLALLGVLAAEHDFQVWVERVGEGEPGQIVIEDGEVINA